MKRATCGIPLILAMIVAGCGGSSSSAEAILKESLGVMDEMSAALENTKSAKEAKPKIEALVNKLKDIEKRSKDMKITKADDEALKKKYEPQLMKSQQRLQAAMTKLAKTDPLGILDLATTMGSLGK